MSKQTNKKNIAGKQPKSTKPTEIESYNDQMENMSKAFATMKDELMKENQTAFATMKDELMKLNQTFKDELMKENQTFKDELKSDIKEEFKTMKADLQKDMQSTYQLLGYVYEDTVLRKLSILHNDQYASNFEVYSVKDICSYLIFGEENYISMSKKLGKITDIADIVLDHLKKNKSKWIKVLEDFLCERYGITDGHLPTKIKNVKVKSTQGIDQFYKIFVELKNHGVWSDSATLLALISYSKVHHQDNFEMEVFDKLEINIRGRCQNLFGCNECLLEFGEVKTSNTDIRNAIKQLNRCCALSTTVFHILKHENNVKYVPSKSISVKGIIFVPKNVSAKILDIKYCSDMIIELKRM